MPRSARLVTLRAEATARWHRTLARGRSARRGIGAGAAVVSGRGMPSSGVRMAVPTVDRYAGIEVHDRESGGRR